MGHCPGAMLNSPLLSQSYEMSALLYAEVSYTHAYLSSHWLIPATSATVFVAMALRYLFLYFIGQAFYSFTLALVN